MQGKGNPFGDELKQLHVCFGEPSINERTHVQDTQDLTTRTSSGTPTIETMPFSRRMGFSTFR